MYPNNPEDSNTKDSLSLMSRYVIRLLDSQVGTDIYFSLLPVNRLSICCKR